LTWFCLSMALFLSRMPIKGYYVAKNVRLQVIDCAWTSYPMKTYFDVYSREDLSTWMQKCFVPFFFGNASCDFPTPYKESTAFNWPGVQLKDPTLQRTGPVQLWQYRTDPDQRLVFPAGALSANNATTKTVLPFQDITSTKVNMKYDKYAGQGYFYQWYVDTTLEDLQKDISYLFAELDPVRYRDSNDKRLTSESWIVTGKTQMMTIAAMLINDATPVVCAFTFETPSEGQAVMSFSIRMLIKLDYSLWAVVYIFLLWFIYEAAQELCQQGVAEFFSDLWSVMKTVNYFMMLAAFRSSIIFIMAYNDAYDSTDESVSTFMHVYQAVEAQEAYMFNMMPVMFTMWVQLLQYLTIIPGLGLPIDAYNRAGVQVISIMISIAVFACGVTVAFFVWFSNDFMTFRSVGYSNLQLLQALDGYPDLLQFSKNNSPEGSGKGSVSLLLYLYVMVFFVMGMLIAIVSSAYSEVHAEFLAAGEKPWTLDRVAKFLKKTHKAHSKVVEEDYGGSWWKYGNTRFRRKTIPNWFKRYFCKQYVDEPEWEDPTEDKDVVDDTVKSPITDDGKVTYANTNAYLKRRQQMEDEARESLKAIFDEVAVMDEHLHDCSDHLQDVEILGEHVDSGLKQQSEVQKTILSLATEVLDRVN